MIIQHFVLFLFLIYSRRLKLKLELVPELPLFSGSGSSQKGGSGSTALLTVHSATVGTVETRKYSSISHHLYSTGSTTRNMYSNILQLYTSYCISRLITIIYPLQIQIFTTPLTLVPPLCLWTQEKGLPSILSDIILYNAV